MHSCLNGSLIVVITFVLVPNAKGQQLINNLLTVNNGLSSGAVECFYHDSRGFMWIGTRDGLDQFDGNDIKNYEHDERKTT